MKERMKQRLLSLLLAMAMVCSLTAGMPVTAFGADQDIVVLYTNDVHCGVDDNIGYAGLALYKKQMQQQTPYVTLVDAGDAIQGAPIGTLSEGGYLIDIMNYVGYDVAVPGNHEFDYGMSRFLELAGRLNCGYYACNFMDKATGATVFAPYKMIAYGDTKIAYVLSLIHILTLPTSDLVQISVVALSLKKKKGDYGPLQFTRDTVKRHKNRYI